MKGSDDTGALVHGPLQGLRFLALVLLVMYHAVLVAAQPAASGLWGVVARLADAGWIGTDLFLALAGFFAFRSLSRTPGNGGRWMLGRLVRIFPSYWIFLGLYLGGLPFLLTALGQSPELWTVFKGPNQIYENLGYLATLTLNFPFAHGEWIGGGLEPLLTLAIGFQWFLLAWPLVKILGPQRLAAGVLILLALGVVLRILWIQDSFWLSYSLPLTRGDGFLWGLLAGWAVDNRRVPKKLGLVVLAGTLGLGGVFVVTQGLIMVNPLTRLLGFPFIGAYFGVLVLWVSRQDPVGPLRGLLGSLGQISYAGALFKLPLVFFLQDLLGMTIGRAGPGGLFALSLAVLIPLSLVWFYGVEKPLGQLIRGGTGLTRR